jgi:broad specificity phosphatase PhoE
VTGIPAAACACSAYGSRVSARLTLVAHASTSATSGAVFPRDEGLEPRGAAAAAAARLPRATRAVCSPSRAAVETAEALGLAVTVDAAVADWHLGAWGGRALDDVAARHPGDVAAWLGDPDAAPHGGESLTALLARVREWLAGADADGHAVAVTHAAVVRAAVVVTLGAPAAGFWRIDVAPLTATVLRGGPGRWTVRGTALPLDAAAVEGEPPPTSTP